jgi:hypothetical protein
MAALAAAPRTIARALGRASGRRLARRPAPAYAALRIANVEQIRRLTPAQRRAAGRHPEYGRLRLDEILNHWAEHDLNHIEQIRAALRARGAGAVSAGR